MVHGALSDEEKADPEAVHAKVHDLARLGEMKWRYPREVT